jgi:hypothetical protein
VRIEEQDDENIILPRLSYFNKRFSIWLRLFRSIAWSSDWLVVVVASSNS